MSAAKCFRFLAATVLAINVLAPQTAATIRNFDRGLLRKYFKCPTCDPLSCPIPAGYPVCEMVLEPGVCACCHVCARQEGELCGLTAGRCGKGLACRPLPGDPDPLGAILAGNAMCM